MFGVLASFEEAGALPARGTAPRASAIAGCTPGQRWGTVQPQAAAAALWLVNRYRAGLGLRALRQDPVLDAAATWKALHMARFNYMAHADPAPPAARSPGDRLVACGFAAGEWGENLAYGYPSAAAVVEAWLRSPLHRANIEQPDFAATGLVAASLSDGPLFWAQEFGGSAPTSFGQKPPLAAGRATSLSATPVVGRPASPRPGTFFVTGVRVMARGGWADLRVGHTGCRARVGMRLLERVAGSFRDGHAACVWQIPRWAAGGTMTGTIEIRSAGLRTARAFTLLIP